MNGPVQVRLDGAAGSAWNMPPAVPTRLLGADASGRARLVDGHAVEREWTDPLEALRWLAVEARRTPTARWVGFLSYDLAPRFEPALSLRHPGELPLFAFARVDAAATAWAESLSHSPTTPTLTSNFARSEFESAIARAIAYVRAGDIFQVNLSQRFGGGAPPDLASVYDRLRVSSPARYGASLRFGDLTLLCNSPELFLRVSADGRVLTRPIKGTRPAGEGMETALRNSAKDQAELNMIVDLERNDLGRVCEIGSVCVVEPRTIERHPALLHGVAGIAGQLRRDVDFIDLLRATFPGGSVTGAPKLRAMQIIDELEPCARGPYCGAIGYLAGDGSMQFNVAIRTMIAHRGKIEVPVGGGIVADSNPTEEFDETLVKAQAMLNALGVEYGPHMSGVLQHAG